MDLFMATDIPEEVIDVMIGRAAVIDRFDHYNDEDEDDYFSAILYRDTDSRLFRYVESSGMNSIHNGSMGFGQWVVAEDRWADFD